MRYLLKQRALALVLLVVPLLASCSVVVDPALTELAVQDFHDSYNASSFTTIYRNSSPEFQEFVSEDKFTRLLDKLHTKLGAHHSSDLVSWSSKSSFGGATTVTLLYKAQYQHDGQAQESFTFRVRDGLARLYNFNVSSPVLNQKVRSRETEV